MNLSIKREALLKPLQLVTGIVEKRQVLPILSNVLLKADTELTITGTDLEVQLIFKLPIQPTSPGMITVPARKLVDICRSLPEEALITLRQESDKLLIQTGRSRFVLSTLPAAEYPSLDQTEPTLEFTIKQVDLRFLLQRTYFAMAQQDVRFYLNGMLLEVKQGTIRSVATDGHRMALNSLPIGLIDSPATQVIIPRKCVIELLRLLEDSDQEVTVAIMTNHIKISHPSFEFISKLIDSRYPDYDRVIPRGGDKTITVPRDPLKQALNRASILSNEKLRGIQLQLRPNLLKILANNPEREEAEEEIVIDYLADTNLDIGFNVKYLIEVFDTIEDETVFITFSDANNSILIIGDQSQENSLFVVMPMRL